MARKYQKVDDVKKKNPNLSWTEAAHKAGFTGKWTSANGKAKPRTGDREKQASVRKSNLEKGTTKADKALKIQSKKVWNELVPPGKKTFTMGGKIWDYEKFSKDFITTHRKQTSKAAINNRKLQSWFPGRSSHGHSAGTGTKAHVESHWAFHPQDFIENSEDRGLINKNKLRKIRSSGMALTAEEAAKKQLPSGFDLVDDPTSGEVRDRIMRGEPANQVKAEALKRKRTKYLSGGLRKADAVANITANAATGNVAGAAVGGGVLAMTTALQNPATQKAIGGQIARLCKGRAKKSLAKCIPGLDVIISAQETLHYLQKGSLKQAGIAAVSGAIGWVPIIGDGISASLDLTNTGIDISKLQKVNRTPKKRRLKSPTRRLKLGI
tara:strand:+ start:94 stop:1236 length:1143 start_codon:yes stop_codon:yes gene_type:complete